MKPQNQCDCTMFIFTGGMISIEVDNARTETIETVMRRVQTKLQLPPANYALFYDEMELKQQFTVEHYHIKEKSCLKLGYAGKIPASQYVKKHSTTLDHKSTTVVIPETCVKLDVPKGAIPEGKTVDITLSVHWGSDEHPPLENNQFVIGPTICCEPDGTTFCKPVMLSLPHSARNITSRNLTVWNKTSQSKLTTSKYLP